MTITFLAPDGVPISAQRFRQAHAALYGGGSGRRLGVRSGFRVDTPSTTLSATSTTWTLGPCAAVIDPGAATHQGAYLWSSDSNETGAVTAADATNPRKDIVYIQVDDSTAGDGSGAVGAAVKYLAGTPGTTPSTPTLPARSFLVGTLSVPVAGGGSPTVTLNPARFVAAGGVLPVKDKTERDALTAYDGLAVRRMDLPNRPTEVHNGTAWREGRRHARFTSTANPSAGAEWGWDVFVDATPAGSSNTFASPSSASKIALEAGAYAVLAMGGSSSYPGFYFLAIKNDANNQVYASGNNGGGIDWGASAAASVLVLPSATNILLGLRTGNTVASAPVTVDIFKLSD